jgi:putative ABC transport system ATP-binding protein
MASPAEIESPSDSALAIELRGVTKVYSEGASRRTVFEGVDLRVRRGEFVVVIGRSGSGKSTLLNLISGIDLATAGSVVVLGRELERASEEERTLLRRAHIGFVFQFFNLIPTLSVLENLLLPLELQGRLDGAARDRARQLLREVGLDGRASSFPDRLSGGEQQRAALARTLLQEPELVLCDEPTGNLDEESAALVLELVQRLLRRPGRTLVVVTHSPEWLAPADRVLEVHEGRLTERQRDRQS